MSGKKKNVKEDNKIQNIENLLKRPSRAAKQKAQLKIKEINFEENEPIKPKKNKFETARLDKNEKKKSPRDEDEERNENNNKKASIKQADSTEVNVEVKKKSTKRKGENDKVPKKTAVEDNAEGEKKRRGRKKKDVNYAEDDSLNNLVEKNTEISEIAEPIKNKKPSKSIGVRKKQKKGANVKKIEEPENDENLLGDDITVCKNIENINANENLNKETPNEEEHKDITNVIDQKQNDKENPNDENEKKCSNKNDLELAVDQIDLAESPAVSRVTIRKRNKEPLKNVTASKKRAVDDSSDAPDGCVLDRITSRRPNLKTEYAKIDFSCTRQNVLGQEHRLRIASWNIDGASSWVLKGGLEYVERECPDVMCLQKVQCREDKLPTEIRELKGYKQFWGHGKDGYTGVGLLTKNLPYEVLYGMGENDRDDGRCLTAEYEKFYLVNVFAPHSGQKFDLLPQRLQWNKEFQVYISELDKKKPVIICGDLSVAHENTDVANPKAQPGFSTDERTDFSNLLKSGFVDTFRNCHPNDDKTFTCWEDAQARGKNSGSRFDYFLTSSRVVDTICDSVVRNKVYGWQHCPVVLFIAI